MNQLINYRTDGESMGPAGRAATELSVPARSQGPQLVTLLFIVLSGFLTAYLFVIFAVAMATAQQPAQMQANLNPVDLVLQDQFERKADLAALRGQVVILVYGDQKATDTCRKVGESLHVCWHPEAKGKPPAKAQAAPVVPLENLKPGQASPNVLVVPVACCGKVPGVVQGIIRDQVAKGSPDVVVWMDFAEHMKTAFGQTAGEPNVVVFDCAGRLRWKCLGTPDQAAMDRLVPTVQSLRTEAVK
jgi:hypothetical protein